MWLPGLPSAGGNAPLWQAEHCAVTTTWVWFHRVDFQLKVLWQAAQLVEPTGMWVAGLPVAWLPLWQLAQEVLWSKPLWSKPVAGVQPFEVWQVSQLAVVAMWSRVLPAAMLPLWQLWQVPGETVEWLKRAPVKRRVSWQESQLAWVGTCWAGITVLLRANRAPPLWQLAQSFGVPLKTPFTWQDSQRSLVWAPVKG